EVNINELNTLIEDFLSENLKDKNNFKLIAYASSGNPRRFLNLLDKVRQEENLTKLKLTAIIREHSKNELWEYHDKLVQGNIDLRGYAEIGRKFIEDYVIPKLQDNNKKVRQKKVRTISIESEVNEDFKRLLRTLEYSGIINFTKSQKTTGDNLGNYYSLNLSLCFSENILKVEEMGKTDTRRGLSFTANSPIIKEYTDKILELLSSDCPKCTGKFNKNDKFCPNCGNDLRNIESVFDRMLSHRVDSLKIYLVANTIKSKLKESFLTIKDLIDAEDSELLKITHIGPKRLAYIKIAIRDYISG
ncbi:zinc ribbon domain-containing protein, partial [Sulfurimonas sp. SAG-AH-194-C20]